MCSGRKPCVWRLVYLSQNSSAAVLEDGIQVGLAVVVCCLEVVHLLFQTLHVLLDSVLVLCQADLDVGLWACDKPRMTVSGDDMFMVGGLCELTSFRHLHRRWHRMADRRVRQQSAGACGFRGSLCSSGS